MRKELLHTIFLCASCLMVQSCSNQQMDELNLDSTIKISMGITTRSVEGKEMGEGDPEDLKVWIFGEKDGGTEKVTYIHQTKEENELLFNDGVDIHGNPIEVIEELIENGKEYSKLNFYVLLNSGNATWKNATEIGENTSLEILQDLSFTAVNQSKADDEMPMFGTFSQVIDNRTEYDIDIEVVRTVAKLELFFAKNNDISKLYIKGIDLHPVVSMGYLNPSQPKTDIYATSSPTAIKLIDEEVEISNISTEEYGDFSKDEENFFQMSLKQPYLLENPYGLTWEDNQLDDLYDNPEGTDNGKYYKITVHYRLDGVDKEKDIYLPPIERNVLYKIYIRVREIYWKASVCPYGSYVLQPEFGL